MNPISCICVSSSGFGASSLSPRSELGWIFSARSIKRTFLSVVSWITFMIEHSCERCIIVVDTLQCGHLPSLVVIPRLCSHTGVALVSVAALSRTSLIL